MTACNSGRQLQKPSRRVLCVNVPYNRGVVVVDLKDSKGLRSGETYTLNPQRSPPNILNRLTPLILHKNYKKQAF